jgi:hypothetical protein
MAPRTMTVGPTFYALTTETARYSGPANVVLSITVFRQSRSTMATSPFGCFDPKVVAMLAEIFIVRAEAKARLAEEVLPSSASSFIPFIPRTQFAFKQTDLNADEAPSEERPVRVVR